MMTVAQSSSLATAVSITSESRTGWRVAVGVKRVKGAYQERPRHVELRCVLYDVLQTALYDHILLKLPFFLAPTLVPPPHPPPPLNRYWFSNKANAINGYEAVLASRGGHAPTMKTDISYWVNYSIQQNRPLGGTRNSAAAAPSTFCLNCAGQSGNAMHAVFPTPTPS